MNAPAGSPDITLRPDASAWHPAVPPRVDRDWLGPVATPLPTDSDHTDKASDANSPIGAAVIATGHQATLWHPGIFAKYLAAVHAARAAGAAALNLVVDHDLYDPLLIDLPTQQGDTLRAAAVSLGSGPNLPPRMREPVDGEEVADKLAGHRRQLSSVAMLDPLIDAWRDLPETPHLGAQMAVVLARLMQPYVGSMPTLCATDLMRQPPAEELIDAMAGDARACVRAYNSAAGAASGAGIRPLHDGVDVIELPLWLLTKRGRRPVFIDAAGRDRGDLFAAGGPVGRLVDEGVGVLAPRALSLTALLRSSVTDLFIHGTGGGVYDRVTESWWRQWRGEALAPMAVVSANLYLPFDAPTADAGEVAHAAWWAHHLPHNIDRVTGIDDDLVRQKRAILEHMDDDRDAARRGLLWRRLTDINGQLADDHEPLLIAAQRDLAAARTGTGNRQLASRRDWCFALYPPAQLEQLSKTIASAFGDGVVGYGLR